MTSRTASSTTILLLLTLMTTDRAAAQTAADSAALFTMLAARDSALFDAFNTCNVPAFESFLSEDLEFYHDFNGLAKPRQKTIEIMAEECRAKHLGRRELVPGSLEVHPLRGFGAIQMGVHRFFVRTPTGETPGSTAKFIHVWQNTNGTWKITRILSFDHRK